MFAGSPLVSNLLLLLLTPYSQGLLPELLCIGQLFPFVPRSLIKGWGSTTRARISIQLRCQPNFR